MMTGVIIAAGTGGRLGRLTKKTPKPLLIVAGRPIIAYGIHFLERLGVKRIVVVGGYRYQDLKKSVHAIDNSIEVYENKDFTLGNLYSLKVALNHIDDDFFLLHPDHIFRKDIVKKVETQLCNSVVMFTDHDRTLCDDDMKILTDESGLYLKNISKQLKTYNFGYVGLTHCPKKHLALYKEKMQQVLDTKEPGKVVTEDVIRAIAESGKVNILLGDISGSRWYEIDTPSELESAVEAIEMSPSLYW